MMKKKPDVKQFLILNYLVTFLLLYGGFKLASVSSRYIVENYIYKDQTLSYDQLSDIYRPDLEKMNVDLMTKLGGWVEILDEQNNIIFIKGKKLDQITHYSERQLLAMLVPQSKDDHTISSLDEKGGIIDLAFVKGKKGENYTMLLKFDRKKIVKTVQYMPSLKNKEDVPLILKTNGVKTFFLVFYMLIGLLIYSRISARFITKPLRSFREGIAEMRALNYKVRFPGQKLKELEEVEREFNVMAERLQAAEEEKRQLDESKKRLLVDISHDLKTPMTSIKGFSKLLTEEEVSEEKKKDYLNIIHQKATYAALLIEDLFQLSKLEDGEYRLNRERTDFTEWLRRLIAGSFEEVREKGFFLDLQLAELPLMVSFDEKLMGRAISNIIGNSLKHNPGGTTLMITCERVENQAQIRIADDGKGIPKEFQDTLFDPFVKTGEKTGGSGLGLAITKKIIEKHGGIIEYVSASAEGLPWKTTFKISLPLMIEVKNEI